MTRKKTLPGFTLVELAVVIAIMGALAYFGMGMAQSMFHNSAKKITAERRAAIVKILAGYVYEHGHLPEPHNPKVKYGIKDKLAVGIIPADELGGLDDSMIRDGYGNYFTYAAASELVYGMQIYGSNKPDASEKECADHLSKFCEANRSHITIKDFKGNIKARPEHVIAFVLISHGPQGSGAFTEAGDHKPVINELERVNADDSPNFVAGKASPRFGHTLWWASRNNFISIYVGGHCGEEPENSNGPKIEQLSEEEDSADATGYTSNVQTNSTVVIPDIPVEHDDSLSSM